MGPVAALVGSPGHRQVRAVAYRLAVCLVEEVHLRAAQRQASTACFHSILAAGTDATLAPRRDVPVDGTMPITQHDRRSTD